MRFKKWLPMSDRLFFVVQGLLKYNSWNIGILLRRWLYRPFFKHIGRNARIKDGVTFKFPSEISLGDNANIGEHCYLVGRGGLAIGDDLLMGAGSKIITSDHVATLTSKPINRQGISFKAITLGDDVWLGFDVKVFHGATIENGVIVGAGSIVTRDTHIPAYSVFGGTPAKLIRNRARD